MSQNKVTVAAAAVVAAVIAVGYPAASWYLGKQIEATHAEIDAKIAAIPYLKLVRHDYQRGLFSADETITIEIPSSLCSACQRPRAACCPFGGAARSAARCPARRTVAAVPPDDAHRHQSMDRFPASRHSAGAWIYQVSLLILAIRNLNQLTRRCL